MTEENVHLYWHRLRKGMCLTCGYHCIDCPEGVASCKCTPKAEHVFEDKDCRRSWCRIHYYPRYHYDYDQYPFDVNIKTSEQGWIKVTVYCGPGAFYPSKAGFFK